MVPAGLITVLNYVAAWVSGTMDIRPDEPATAYLPDEADLLTRFATPAVRTALLTSYLAEVQSHWNAARLDGLLDKLARVRTEGAAMATRPGAARPLAGLPNSGVSAFHEHLALDNENEAGGRANILGRDLVVGTATLASVTGTAANARRAIMHLRRLDDVLTRAQAARIAALVTGSHIADVLALYRTEGNLDALPSTASLASGVPSGTADAISIVSPSADLRHLVWLAHPSGNAPLFPNFTTATDVELRESALVIWFVQVCGLDEVIQLPRPWRSNFAAWSAANWRSASSGGAPTAADQTDAQVRWDALLTMLQLSRPVASTSIASSAIMVTPDDPPAFIAGLLQEGVMRQRALGLVESLLSSPVPPPLAGTRLSTNMAYLHFHAGTEQLKVILVRALVAAMTTSGLQYSQLRAAILNDITIGTTMVRLEPVKSAPDALARPALLSAWPAIESWLKVDDHLALLCDFVETIDGNRWSSWGQHRGNLSRYRVLRDYYARVMR